MYMLPVTHIIFAYNIGDGDSLGNGDCFIGFDLGTSGARMSIVGKVLSGDDDTRWRYMEVLTEALAWDENMIYDNANDWRKAIDTLLSRAQGTAVMKRVKAIKMDKQGMVKSAAMKTIFGVVQI